MSHAIGSEVECLSNHPLYAGVKGTVVDVPDDEQVKVVLDTGETVTSPNNHFRATGETRKTGTLPPAPELAGLADKSDPGSSD